MTCEEIELDVDMVLQNPEDNIVLDKLEKHFKECQKCRSEFGEVINTAAKLSEVGQISDIVDVSDEFIERTKQEAYKESDKFQVRSQQIKLRNKAKIIDLIIKILLISTAIGAIILICLAAIYL